LLRSSDLSFYKYSLKSAGKLTTAGSVFLSFALLWMGLNAHSGYIRYHEALAAQAYDKIRIPDELALARVNPARWLSAADVEGITGGKKHYYAAMNAALFTNAPAIPKLAWLEYLSGNSEGAVNLLKRAADNQDGQARALSLYYRGAILNRLGRNEQALADLDEAIKERPDLVTAREEKGEALWKLGRREDAVAAWKDALKGNPNLPLANNLLAAASTLAGKPDEAAAYEKKADSVTPNDPLFHWTLGMRLQNVGMNDLAEKHFQKAIELNPDFRRAR
jgi:tetratricopeptide (TPR) repeat protein